MWEGQVWQWDRRWGICGNCRNEETMDIWDWIDPLISHESQIAVHDWIEATFLYSSANLPIDVVQSRTPVVPPVKWPLNNDSLFIPDHFIFCWSSIIAGFNSLWVSRHICSSLNIMTWSIEFCIANISHSHACTWHNEGAWLSHWGSVYVWFPRLPLWWRISMLNILPSSFSFGNPGKR